jgi:hypothetical protein
MGGLDKRKMTLIGVVIQVVKTARTTIVWSPVLLNIN